MVNDLTTLAGALVECKDQLISELANQGVTASYSSTTGLLGLIHKISDIQAGSLTLTTNKTVLSHYDSETATLTATHSLGAGKSVSVYNAVTGSKIGDMTDNDDGTYSYTYNSAGVGDISMTCATASLESNSIDIEDCLKVGIQTTDTWHNIDNANSITVTDGVATGYNKLLDFYWDNTEDWQITCEYKVNGNLANGLLFADVTNTNNFDYNTFTLFDDGGKLDISGHTGTTQWSITRTNLNSRVYNPIKITNIDGELSFYINDTLYTTHQNISAINNICVGMYTWENGNGSFKNLKVKKL